MSLLLGQIEGLRCRLAAEIGGALEELGSFAFTSSDDFMERLAAEGAKLPTRPSAVALGVQGPVSGARGAITGHSVIISAKQIQRRLETERAGLWNDFEALACGAAEAEPGMLVPLAQGMPAANAPKIVCGPGAGLGLATLCFPNGQRHALTGEGGHQAFAPGSEEEIELWRELAPNRRYVSFEDVLSDEGLVSLYRFACKKNGWTPSLSVSADVARAADERSDRAANEATRMFVSALGTFAGNACLSAGARGGVIIAGRLAQTLQPSLQSGAFMERFQRRGAMSLYIADVPVHLLIDPMAPFKGLRSLHADSCTPAAI